MNSKINLNTIILVLILIVLVFVIVGGFALVSMVRQLKRKSRRSSIPPPRSFPTR